MFIAKDIELLSAGSCCACMKAFSILRGQLVCKCNNPKTIIGTGDVRSNESNQLVLSDAENNCLTANVVHLNYLAGALSLSVEPDALCNIIFDK